MAETLANAIAGTGATQNAINGTGATQTAIGSPVAGASSGSAEKQAVIGAFNAAYVKAYDERNSGMPGAAARWEAARDAMIQVQATGGTGADTNVQMMQSWLNNQTVTPPPANQPTQAGATTTTNPDGGTFNVIPSYTQPQTTIDPVTGQITSTPSTYNPTGQGMDNLAFGNTSSGITGSTSGGGGGGGGGGSQSGSTSGSGSNLVDQTRAFNDAASASGGGIPVTAPSVYGPTASGYSSAMNASTAELNKGMTNVNNVVNQGIAQNNQAVANATNSINNLYGLGYNTSNATYDQAINSYQPIASGAAGDYQYLKDMTQGGFDKNFADYQNSGAYQFGLNAGVNAVQQSAAARGLLRSGATLKGISNYAQGYQNSQFLNYQQQQLGAANNLANYSGNALNSQTALLGQKASNQAGLLSNQGNALGNTALAGSGYNTALNTSLAQAYGQQASAIANIKMQGMLGQSSTNIPITG